MTATTQYPSQRRIGLFLIALVIAFGISQVASAVGEPALLTPIDIDDFSGNESVDDFGFAPFGVPVDDYNSILDYRIEFVPDPRGGPMPIIGEDPPYFGSYFTVPYIGSLARGTLSIIFSEPQRRFGFDWRLDPRRLRRTHMIELFDASGVSLGEQVYLGVDDGVTRGGFAGIESSVPFERADVTWASPFGRYGIDNIRFEPIPEPSSYVTLILGLAGVVGVRRLAKSSRVTRVGNRAPGRTIGLLVALFVAIGTSQVACAVGIPPLLTPIEIDDFSGNESIDDFEFPDFGTPVVDYFSIFDMQFGYIPDINGSPEPIIGDGPIFGDDITPQYIDGIPRGILTMSFNQPQNRIGFNWGITRPGGNPRGPIIELFDAFDVSLGEQLFFGTPNPVQLGGFAGVESNVQFTRAEVRWAVPFGGFGIDNLRFEPIPEPSTCVTIILGLVAVFGMRMVAQDESDAV